MPDAGAFTPGLVAQRVALRREADEKSKAITLLNYGERVRVLEKGETFHKVQLSDGSEGFLPARPGRRRTRLAALAGLGRPVVLYEGPHRVTATLATIAEVFGPGVEVVLARELTKQFEEFRRGTPGELLAGLPPGGLRGEVTLIVNPGAPAGAEPEPAGAETDGPAAPDED